MDVSALHICPLHTQPWVAVRNQQELLKSELKKRHPGPPRGLLSDAQPVILQLSARKSFSFITASSQLLLKSTGTTFFFFLKSRHSPDEQKPEIQMY